MPVTEIGDPRLQALFGANDPRDAGVRPTMRLPRRGLPPIAIAIGVLLVGVLLFAVLNARRVSQVEPSVRTGTPVAGATAWASPPPLYVPPAEAPITTPAAPVAQPTSRPQVILSPVTTPAVRPAPQVIYAPQPAPQMAPPPTPQQRVSAGAPLVIDTGGAAAGATAGAPGTYASLLPSGQTNTRMRASALANRSMTVPQGTLIPAVLETGFDSTQPGFARAIVSRNVRSFDGTNVLVPRGSRLIGEYRSDVAQGQKRAVIIWTRLIRPDGMTIGMDSPAVDTLGRGGVQASVNTHFFQRLGDALLQTTVGIGGALAQRAVTGPVIVLPGAAGTATSQIAPTNSYVPTLKVPAGKSISIFVAHDLDFSAAGAGR
jgi:type IV secretion system protein VirB10